MGLPEPINVEYQGTTIYKIFGEKHSSICLCANIESYSVHMAKIKFLKLNRYRELEFIAGTCCYKEIIWA